MCKILKNPYAFLLLLLLLASCGKEDADPAPQAPAIESISPLSGKKGSLVTINGSNFSTNASANKVLFNGVAAEVRTASTTSLTVIVPAKSGDGPVTVEVAGKTSTGPTFDHIETYTVSTFAGSSAGYTDGQGTSARFDFPAYLAIDAAANLYVTSQSRIRKITPAGMVSTLAGDGTSGYLDGTGTNAKFSTPIGLAADAEGTIYVADVFNHRIRKITPAGQVSTLAGSGVGGFADATGVNAQFSHPYALSMEGGNIYVGELTGSRIRKVTVAGVVSTIAGNGTAGYIDGAGTNARFDQPGDFVSDPAGNLYVADPGNQRIRKISPAGVVTTLAGSGAAGSSDGPGASASFRSPYGLAIDAMGNIYVADAGNNLIRKITPTGLVSTVAGSTEGYADGEGTTASFNNPISLAMDAAGDLYVSDMKNHRIRKISIE